MSTGPELVAERLNAILGEQCTTSWQAAPKYAREQPGEHALAMNLEDLLGSYGLRRGEGDQVSSPRDEKRGATKAQSRSTTKASLDASAKPFVPLAAKKLDASAAPFVPAGTMNAGAAPFIPGGPAILKLGSVPPSGKLSASAAPFVPNAAASFHAPKRTAKAPPATPPLPEWVKKLVSDPAGAQKDAPLPEWVQKLVGQQAGAEKAADAPLPEWVQKIVSDRVFAQKAVGAPLPEWVQKIVETPPRAEKPKTSDSGLQEDSLMTPPPGPPPGLSAPPGLDLPASDKKRERTVSAELSEQSTASGSPASSPGPSPKPMYSLQDLLRFRLPASVPELQEQTPILYSTMSVKDLQAQSPKSPPSAKKEKRDRTGSGDRTKARAGSKLAKEKVVGSWR